MEIRPIGPMRLSCGVYPLTKCLLYDSNCTFFREKSHSFLHCGAWHSAEACVRLWGPEQSLGEGDSEREKWVVLFQTS